MTKSKECISNKNDKRIFLVESSQFVSKIKLTKKLKESISMESGKNGTLIVRNIPATICNRPNQNNRIYTTEVLQEAIDNAQLEIETKQLIGKPNEHPESSFIAPSDASHVIINAYIKKNVKYIVDGKQEVNDMLFMDWEILNTRNGKDLRALFEAECSIGTSIRGLGELEGKYVKNYQILGIDCVGQPSSSTYTRMPVSESVKVEFKDANELKENYTVMSSSTNVVRDLSQAGILQQQLNANPYGTITKTSTKVDQETDPKTGAQTSITTVEADTEDEVTDLNQAFQMAHKAMTNGISKVSSVTIEANEDEDEQGNKTESVDMSDNGLEAYVPESAPMEEGQVVAQGQPEGIEFLKRLDDKGRYMFLSRMQTDCKYFLDGHEYNKFLWAENPEKQIEYMKWLYNSFPDDKKPEWISMEEIEDYERQMAGKGKEDHSRDDIYTTESTMTESKKEEEPKDPNEGRQYILKIKNNDPDMKEDSDNAPEFVAMRGNAIRFTKDPKKALHFTQGMEESGIVHCSNIKKLLADMGYGEQNLEKWYKRDNGEVAPKKEGLAGAILGGAAGAAVGHPFIGGAAGSLAQDALLDDSKKESAQLTEDGNTKYSANIEVINKGGLPETKSLQISSNDLEGALKEVSNHWQQQQASNDVNQVNSLMLVDNQSGEKFNYDPKSNQLLPVNGSNVQQQPVQQTEEPKIMEPDDVELGVKEESIDGEIKQNDKTLDMDIDDNTHVEKEFDTQAQASVAKAGIESGKLSGDVLLSDAVKPGWYVAHDKIGVSGPYETREACMEGLDGYEDQVSVYEVTENDLNEVLFKNPSEPSDYYVEKPLEEEKDPTYLALKKNGYYTFDDPDAYMQYINDNKDFLLYSDVYTLDQAKEIYADYTDSKINKELACHELEPFVQAIANGYDKLRQNDFNESTLVPVRFSNIKWDEKDVAYRMFEDIEKDMQVSHIEPNINNADVLVEYFDSYMDDLKGLSIDYNVNPNDIKESVNYQNEILEIYNQDKNRQYPKIKSADINLR